jgi:hypothetical protein
MDFAGFYGHSDCLSYSAALTALTKISAVLASD